MKIMPVDFSSTNRNNKSPNFGERIIMRASGRYVDTSLSEALQELDRILKRRGIKIHGFRGERRSINEPGFRHESVYGKMNLRSEVAIAPGTFAKDPQARADIFEIATKNPKVTIEIEE